MTSPTEDGILLRLDKYLSDSGKYTRSESSRLIRQGKVTADGVVIRDPAIKVDESTVRVAVDGITVSYSKYNYLMLNKPQGTVCTTDSGDERSVMQLVPKYYSGRGAFPCGRLDIDTTGLVIITDDGPLAHALLSPKHHCEKKYRFSCISLTDDQIKLLENGLEFSDFTSKPCSVDRMSPQSGTITITEGKYHQIKRMFLAVGSEITELERISFAGIDIDTSLGRGEWRELTDDEINILHKNAAQGIS